MQQWVSTNVRWLLPVLLLVLKTGMKSVVGSRYKTLEMWKTILQVPIDVGFLAISFLAAALLIDPTRTPVLFPWILGFLVLMLVSIVIWEESPTEIGVRQVCTSIFLGALNAALAIAMLVISLTLL